MNSTRSLLVCLAALGLTGCYIESESTDAPVYIPGSSSTDSISIDTDAALSDNAPGVATGLYVEYFAGGLWHLYASCGDVSLHGECYWDVVTTTRSGAFQGYDADSLEGADSLDADDRGAWMAAYTGYDYDGFYVQTTPGEPLEIDALLDSGAADDYVFWVRGGNVVTPPDVGLRSPIVLVPNLP